MGLPTIAFLTVAGGAAFLVWHYLKDLELPTWQDAKEAAGGAVADVIIDVGELLREQPVFEDNPTTPELFQLASGRVVELTRCQRWEQDATDILAKVQAGGLSSSETVQAALATKRVAKNMKKEGCDRPSAISQAQWDES